MGAGGAPFQDSRARFGLAVIGVAILVALCAPLIASDPAVQRDIVATRFLPPLSTDLNGAFHLLGTDRFGRDVWARLAFGARVSLGVGVLAVLLSVVIGTVVGAAGGFLQGVAAAGLLRLPEFAVGLPR